MVNIDLIETERLVLIKYEVSDAEIFFNSVRQNLEHLSEVLVKPVREMKNVNDAQELILLLDRFWENGERFIIPIWLKDSRLLVGECYLGAFNSDKTEAEIGYLLFKEFEGKGFAYESTIALIKNAFEKVKLKKLWLKCDSDNHRSIKLASKLRFILKEDAVVSTRIKSDKTEVTTLNYFLDNASNLYLF